MNTRAVSPQKTLASPIWVLGIRIAQVLLSIIVLGMAAAWSDYTLFDAPSMAIAAAVLTWAVVAYILVSEKVAAANIIYSVYVVIILDIFMVIIWLSTWALNAARRAQLGGIYGIGGGSRGGGQFCYNGVCYDYKKRSIESRSITWSTLSGLLAGIAGIGALIWVLFIVTLVWTIISFLAGRKDGRFTLGSSSTTTAAAADHNMEEQKVQGQPVQQPQQAQGAPQFTQPQYDAQQQPQQQAYPQYPQQPAEAQGQYQAPQVATEHQQQYPHDPNQVTPQQHQQ